MLDFVSVMAGFPRCVSVVTGVFTSVASSLYFEAGVSDIDIEIFAVFVCLFKRGNSSCQLGNNAIIGR